MNYYKAIKVMYDEETGLTTSCGELVTYWERRNKYHGLPDNCFVPVEINRNDIVFHYKVRYEKGSVKERRVMRREYKDSRLAMETARLEAKRKQEQEDIERKRRDAETDKIIKAWLKVLDSPQETIDSVLILLEAVKGKAR